MGRLPAMLERRVQVEYYSGAHWSHIYEILRNKNPTTDQVTKVILLFSIIDRTHTSTELLGKLIKKTLGAAGHTLPNAQIYVLYLPKKQGMILSQINAHITSTGKTMEVFPYKQFLTELDLTHWTRMTGREIWQHWVVHLKGRGEASA